MDYEKKYNEALERARALWREAIEKEYVKDYLEDYETIFPELAESEDERIRKWLVDYFGSIKETVWIHRDITCEQILAWLEKQKENPKNAISIPADCASNAKCEDRWHKVGDSLPDNPREVLCKDEAGNYFIGRYYTEEGWEISNYDDEDKPHHLNPPVSKWIDFPSEKQKKPENTSASTMAPSCWAEEPSLQKEQKPAWSEEDERKRQACISTINEVIDYERERWEDYNPGKPYRPIMKYDEQIDWLKSIRPSWKPSEEQMDALNKARRFIPYNCDILESLYEQLKKL